MSLLITDEYRDVLRQDRRKFGKGAANSVPDVLRLAERYGTQDVLDYGCAQSYLARAMPWPIREYDPAVPGKDEMPSPADVVVCTDVLEHVEPDCLDAVLSHLHHVTRKGVFFIICLIRSVKKLSNEQNAHLIVQPADWWMSRLLPLFTVREWRVEDHRDPQVVAWLEPR